MVAILHRSSLPTSTPLPSLSAPQNRLSCPRCLWLPSTFIDSDALKAAGGDAAKINAKPIGTGPYVLKEWVRGDHITFEANPNYWGTAPKTKTLIFRWSKEAAQRKLELESGTPDGIDNPGTDDIAAINANKALKNYQRPTPNLLYLGINVDTPPWNNEKVRQALAMAIDRDRLIKNFYPPGTTAAQQFVPPTVKPGYTDGFKWYDFDMAKAKKMLEPKSSTSPRNTSSSTPSAPARTSHSRPRSRPISRPNWLRSASRSSWNCKNGPTYLPNVPAKARLLCSCWAGAKITRTPPTGTMSS